MRRLSRCLMLSMVATIAFAVGAFVAPAGAQISAGFGAAPMPSPEPTVTDHSKIRTVGVLSGIGSTLVVQRGRTFGSKRSEPAIADWAVDSFVVSRVREYLDGRFTFKDVDYDVSAMARLPATVLRDTNKTVRGFFSTIPKDVDAYIVVRRESAPSLKLYDPATGDDPPMIVADYVIDVLSPARLDVIATANSQIRYRADGEAYAAEFVGDPDLKPSADAQLSDPQRTRLRSEFERLLSMSLADTLRALDLGATLPPPVAGTRRIVHLEPAQDPFVNIRSVSILSAIGDRFYFGDKGTTVADRSRSLSIPDWGVDGHVEDVARHILSQRFEVKEVTVDRTALLTSTVRDGNLNFNPIVRGIEPTSEVDAHVLFLKFPMPLDYSNYEGLGLGLFNPQDVRSQTKNALFAHYAVVVVDARSLKMIRTISGTMRPDYVAPRPTREIDASLWAESVAQVNTDRKQAIRQSLLDLLTESTEQTLLRVGLTGNAVLYPPGVRPEECQPRPGSGGQPMVVAPVPGGSFGAGAAAGAFGFLLGYAATAADRASGTGRLPMQFDEKGLVC